MRKSRATHRALIPCSMPCTSWCHKKVQLSILTAENAFIFSLFYWLKPLIDEEEEETVAHEESSQQRVPSRKCHILKPANSSLIRDQNPHSSIDLFISLHRSVSLSLSVCHCLSLPACLSVHVLIDIYNWLVDSILRKHGI